MKNLLCLSDVAISVLKTKRIKGKIMDALCINDLRTIEKYINNNSPCSPLMNFNVGKIIIDNSLKVNEKNIYRKLTNNELAKLEEHYNETQSPT
jgi:hypothetical protein